MWNWLSEKFFCAVIFYLKFCEKGETFLHVFLHFLFSFVRTRLQNIMFSTLLSSCMIPDQESTKRQSLPSLGAIRQKKTGFAPPSSILRYQQPHTHQSYVFSTSEKTILHVPRWLAAGGGSPAFPLFFPRNNNNNGGGGDCCCCRCCRSSFCCPPPMLPKSEEELTGLGQVHCLVRQCCCSPPGLGGGGGGGGGSLSDGCSMRESPSSSSSFSFSPPVQQL